MFSDTHFGGYSAKYHYEGRFEIVGFIMMVLLIRSFTHIPYPHTYTHLYPQC